MNNAPLHVVTGANGHLGNNLVRALLNKGLAVRATVRNLRNTEPFAGLTCAVVKADILDKASLLEALTTPNGPPADTLYAVGASFALWAKDPVRDIYEVNMTGMRNTLEAAAERGVRRIVWVSSIAALNYATMPTSERYGYNPDRRNWYYNSKNDSEQQAHELARQYGLDLVSVLPSAMIGGEAFGTLNVSYNILRLILHGEIPVETKITLNWIDVADVAEGCYLAATKGKPGERYILANEKAMSLRDTTQLARQLYPQLGLKLPTELPRPLLYAIVWALETGAKLARREPSLTINDLNMFYGLSQDFDTSKARRDLGFAPKAPREALLAAFAYLQKNGARLGSRQG